MKKAVSLLLVILTVFALSSCGSADTGDTVDVLIPAAQFTADTPASEKLTAKQKKQGIVKAVVHEDGSVTYSFRADKYDGFLAELHETTKKSLDQIIHDEDVTSIKDVTYNDDFSELTFFVDRAAFEGSLDGLTCYGAYLAVSVYKAYARKDDKCTVTIIDESTGDTLGSTVYPDALNAENTTTKD